MDASDGGTLPEVRIVVIYFILASAWIVGSDHYLSATTFDPARIALIQSLKGLNFVLTTAILLYLVLRRAYGGWRRAEAERMNEAREHAGRYRRLSARVETLREEERTRIAREIHDELGQLLTGMKLELRLLEKRLGDRGDQSLNFAIDQLVDVDELVDATITSVRRISSGLRPAALDDLGLGAALVEEAGRFTQRTGIPCSMVVEDFPSHLHDEIRTATFRIFQESLTNVARHAGASHVRARLGLEGNVLSLSIQDDGRGMEAGVMANPNSLGLIGMLERAGQVGGRVRFRPGSESGTSVLLTVPLPPTDVSSN